MLLTRKETTRRARLSTLSPLPAAARRRRLCRRPPRRRRLPPPPAAAVSAAAARRHFAIRVVDVAGVRVAFKAARPKLEFQEELHIDKMLHHFCQE